MALPQPERLILLPDQLIGETENFTMFWAKLSGCPGTAVDLCTEVGGELHAILI